MDKKTKEEIIKKVSLKYLSKRLENELNGGDENYIKEAVKEAVERIIKGLQMKNNNGKGN